MNSTNDDLDRYLGYEEQFDSLNGDREERRRRGSKSGRRPKKRDEEIIAESAQPVGLEGGLKTSYTPSKHEATWLMQSLREFYQQELISDVQALIKGGKEANVYRCAAHPATGERWLAVKVYRPRMFRSLRKDHVYRQGRTALTPDGRPVKAQDRRLQKAIAGKTAYGQQQQHVSWLMHEYTMLEILYEAGGDAPRPFAAGENAIAMGYVGDGRSAAPALNEIRLPAAEAQRLLARVIQNIALMLAYGRVHGDLSAYNILYWRGEVTLIDFPQVVNSYIGRGTRHAFGSRANPDAREILARDITRVCDYFQRQGARCSPQRLTEDLWSRFTDEDAAQRLADASRWLEEE